jgi:hypothetical protein
MLTGMVEGLFTYDEVRRLSNLPPKQLIQFITEKVASVTEKRAMLINIVDRCASAIKESVLEYIEFSLDISDSVLQIFVLPSEELKAMRAKGIVI